MRENQADYAGGLAIRSAGVRAFYALNIFIRLQNRNDRAHMFHVLNLQVQLESEKIRVLSVRWILEILPPCWLITVASDASDPGSLDSTVLSRPLTVRRLSCSQDTSSHSSGASENLLSVVQPTL